MPIPGAGAAAEADGVLRLEVTDAPSELDPKPFDFAESPAKLGALGLAAITLGLDASGIACGALLSVGRKFPLEAAGPPLESGAAYPSTAEGLLKRFGASVRESCEAAAGLFSVTDLDWLGGRFGRFAGDACVFGGVELDPGSAKRDIAGLTVEVKRFQNPFAWEGEDVDPQAASHKPQATRQAPPSHLNLPKVGFKLEKFAMIPSRTAPLSPLIHWDV